MAEPTNSIATDVQKLIDDFDDVKKAAREKAKRDGLDGYMDADDDANATTESAAIDVRAPSRANVLPPALALPHRSRRV
jgi:hypothetical protein